VIGGSRVVLYRPYYDLCHSMIYDSCQTVFTIPVVRIKRHWLLLINVFRTVVVLVGWFFFFRHA